MAIKLTSPVFGQPAGATFSGPASVVPWLIAEGYAFDDANVTDHINQRAVLPADDPQLAVNREAPGQPFGLSGRLAVVTASAIVPNTGLAAGGTDVVITGDHMVDVTGVTFGGVAATNVVVVDDQHVKCTTPPHAAGAVTVVITDSDGSATKPTFYTYS